MNFEFSLVCVSYAHSSFGLLKAHKSLLVSFLLNDDDTIETGDNFGN